jgi:GT2 family glycosyltransferase
MEALGVIGVPAQDMVYTAFFKSYTGLEKPRGTILYSTENVLTATARNKIVEYTLGHKTTKWLFFMDSDMVFPSAALTRLLSHKLDIVGGTYFQRFHPHNIIAYDGPRPSPTGGYEYLPLNATWLDHAAQHQATIPMTAKFTGAITDNAPPIQVGGIGTGCLLISRKVLEAMSPPWFSYRDDGSEDLYFCRKAQALGIPIYLDLGLICGHISRQVIGPIHNLTSMQLQPVGSTSSQEEMANDPIQ